MRQFYDEWYAKSTTKLRRRVCGVSHDCVIYFQQVNKLGKNTIKPNQTRLWSLSPWKSLNPIRPDAFVSTPTKFKIGCLGQFFYTQPILYIQGAQNVKEQVSSFKSLDLVVIQSWATNLMNFWKSKIYKVKYTGID